MSDFENFEDENADAKIKADIESSDKMVRLTPFNASPKRPTRAATPLAPSSI